MICNDLISDFRTTTGCDDECKPEKCRAREGEVKQYETREQDFAVSCQPAITGTGSCVFLFKKPNFVVLMVLHGQD